MMSQVRKKPGIHDRKKKKNVFSGHPDLEVHPSEDTQSRWKMPGDLWSFDSHPAALLHATLAFSFCCISYPTQQMLTLNGMLAWDFKHQEDWSPSTPIYVFKTIKLFNYQNPHWVLWGLCYNKVGSSAASLLYKHPWEHVPFPPCAQVTVQQPRLTLDWTEALQEEGTYMKCSEMNWPRRPVWIISWWGRDFGLAERLSVMKPFLQGHPLKDSLAFRSSAGVSLQDTSV